MFVRRAFVLAAAVGFVGAGVALAQLEPGPADAGVGTYRGVDGAGARTVITVYRLRPDRLSLKSNHRGVPDSEVDVKREGDLLVNVEGDGRVSFNLTADPVELTYKPREGVSFTGGKL